MTTTRLRFLASLLALVALPGCRPSCDEIDVDVTGTSKRPVTVQLPDLNELAAQAAPSFGVAFAKPVGSVMVGVAYPRRGRETPAGKAKAGLPAAP